jgi:hypothetical protein
MRQTLENINIALQVDGINGALLRAQMLDA